MQGNGIGPRVAAEQPDCSGVGPQQLQQHPPRRGLACTVRSKKADDLTGAHGEIEPGERWHGAESLSQPPHCYGGRCDMAASNGGGRRLLGFRRPSRPSVAKGIERPCEVPYDRRSSRRQVAQSSPSPRR